MYVDLTEKTVGLESSEVKSMGWELACFAGNFYHRFLTSTPALASGPPSQNILVFRG